MLTRRPALAFWATIAALELLGVMLAHG